MHSLSVHKLGPYIIHHSNYMCALISTSPHIARMLILRYFKKDNRSTVGGSSAFLPNPRGPWKIRC